MISDEQYLQFNPCFAQEDIEKEENRFKFLQLLNSLPQTVKDLLTSESTTEKIIKIGDRFGLGEFDTEALSLVVRKLATGEVPVTQGVSLMVNETGLPLEKTESILALIINDILAPIIPNIQTPLKPPPKIPDKPDLKIDPEVNRNNVVDLRNR